MTTEIRNQAGTASRAVAQTVRCPYCKAGVGMPCQRQTRRGGPAPFPHFSRTSLALEHTTQEGQ